jgi:SAM-dependent methyltransferase
MNKDSAKGKLRRWARRFCRPATTKRLRSPKPLSDDWGFDRGKPIDRYYIERFLAANRKDIQGRVLEVADSKYTLRYGTALTQTEVLDIDPCNRNATLLADLSAADSLPSMVFDCFILTQTLQYIYDSRAAVNHAHRLLRPGGVLLATVPSVSRITPAVSADYWRFTIASCSQLFARSFGAENTAVESFGNVLTCIAFLRGMACEELSEDELTINDDSFPLIIGIRAVKAA